MKRRHLIQQLTAKNIAHNPAAPKPELLALLNASGGAVEKPHLRIVNYAGGSGTITVTYNAKEANEPVEIMVCEDIGKDAWTGEGFTLKDLRDALNGVPTTRNLKFFTNSPGGSVGEGTSIRNWLSNWGGDITNTIIGIAASTASWCIPADKTLAYKNSQMFLHRSMGGAFGNVDEMQKVIEYLNKTDGQIAQMYADQSGKTPDEMLALMKNETLLTGEEALNIGLVDELVDGEAKNQFTPEWLNSAKQKLSALNSLRVANGGHAAAASAASPAAGNEQTATNKLIMNREKMIALLNKWGVKIPENATDAQLEELISAGKPAENKQPAPAAADAAPAALNADDQKLLNELRNQVAVTRRNAIQIDVEKAASAGKIPATEIENWVNDAVAATDHPTTGNPVLVRLNKLEGRAPGVAPVPESVNKLEVTSAEFKDIRKGFEAHNEATESWRRGNNVSMQEISNSAKAKAQFFKKFRNRFMEMVNANVLDSGLQRQLILRDIVIRDFKRRIAPLDLFSTVFRNVPLEGTDKVEVPYFDLDGTASQAFGGSYAALVSATASGVREITVGWGKGHDGNFGVGHNRAVQALSFSSHEIATQPYLKIAQLAALKAEKLVFDIFQDILGVVKVANFPNLLDAGNKITKSFDQFSSDDLADLKVLCKKWPMEGRGLLLDSAYDGNLMKDPSFKNAYQTAFDKVKNDGNLPPNLYSFNYVENPNIPDNGIKLSGLAFWKYAILTAFAPVPPVEEVRRSGTIWELITDEDGMVSLEYRTFGSNDTDSATHVIESNYGFGPGVKTAIKPIVGP